jgi:hypothetical protein
LPNAWQDPITAEVTSYFPPSRLHHACSVPPLTLAFSQLWRHVPSGIPSVPADAASGIAASPVTRATAARLLNTDRLILMAHSVRSARPPNQQRFRWHY